MKPRAYYNEIDLYCANWLYNLIQAGLIADGDIDTRSIADIKPSDLKGYTQCHFFAGLGGWSGALRLAGWADDRQVWTGSCPCQPFSLAGKQGGFADERHLWPYFRYLIAQCRPATVFGEQVASATEWLGLVRGDLEALDYAVGCMPVQAASAGADHLRDRYWFVGDHQGDRWREGRPEHEVRERSGSAVAGASSSNMGIADSTRRNAGQQTTETARHRYPFVATGSIMADTHDTRSQGRIVLPERAGERLARPDGVANTDIARQGEGWQQRSGEFSGPGGDQEACSMGNSAGERRDGRESAPRSDRGVSIEVSSRSLASDTTFSSNIGGEPRAEQRCVSVSSSEDNSYEWVIGADGKARRVKPGIRLLAHGVPARVAKLRALGNAIDLRPAAAFIKAYDETLTELPTP